MIQVLLSNILLADFKLHWISITKGELTDWFELEAQTRSHIRLRSVGIAHSMQWNFLQHSEELHNKSP